ncbi:HsdR family type I site-specific deoxyribonuclease [Melioribacter roseus P3M-2]|uniref:Type I restriction enzyme endonuclease subunit n=1 Tax=Melioribacter roseus (strain DSM 23840 / JCM 17771 / VKM B-2668 / P3M-2) TaxID=1191523 RepID=I6ZR37_MELRP|nr:type I restriction endonuclease subunit R [Melioribacter roseus]AFN74524.1 HsdR family type I site-specific deoxyribonuclease [Melioribacter roseus P3M-2]
MFSKLIESDIEQFTIELLENLGYEYVSPASISPDGDQPERQTFDDVLLINKLKNAVDRIIPTIPAEAKEDAIKQILRISSPDLITNNETFHRMLTEGINVTYSKDGNQRGDLVWLIDFKNPENNEFTVVNQFTVTSTSSVTGTVIKRPDVILFVNGIPLVVIELKNAVDEEATIKSAFKQIQTYKQTIPQLFTYNGFAVISDGLEARAGTISSDFSRFMAWKSVDGTKEASHLVSQLEILIKGMLNKNTLLDLIRHFIVFEKSKKEDPDSNLTFIQTTKKLAGYHQYFAVNKAIERTLQAASGNGNRKGGVIWHTQGSGKSLTMVFYAGKIVLQLDNPTILVITDRNDLDDQLFDTFADSKQLLRQEPVQAENREHLKELLKVSSGGIVFTTIQKFQSDTSTGSVSDSKYEQLSERTNIVVIADEAHRTQYGFKARTIDERDENGNHIGKKTVYGFAKYLRDALPNATFIGFTGTPIEKTDKNTPAVFGDYVDIYDIAQAVEDGATVRIFYEGRLAKINLSEEGKKLIKELDAELESEDITSTQRAKAKWTQLEALVGSEDRFKQIAADIIYHYEERQKVFEGKAMIVAMSRRIAVKLYDEIIKLRPDWHNEDLKKGKIKVVMTAASSDGPELAKHHTTKDQRRVLADRMKNPDDELKIVIVRDMWLTGFDVPCLHTLYIDKPMQGHTLMQAIARVNRVYKDKPGGLIVDYLGIASDLKQALSFYSDSGGKGDPAIAQEKAVQLMLEKLEIVSRMFLEKPVKPYSKDYEELVKDPSVPYLGKDKGLLYEQYFTADAKTKLDIILAAEEHILSLENGKKRFIDEVTALSKAFAIAIPHEQALDVKDEVAFFQAVKARLLKFDSSSPGKSSEEIETTIKQVIDKALVSDRVIDIFDAAGIKKPDISILSEEFLMEVRNMQHKNIALETLRKLLNDEIKSRIRTNLVQGKTLMEMLEKSIKKYHSKILTAAEVIEELIALGKEIQNLDKEPKEMGLSDFEYAFYTAIANNDSAREVMKKDKLRELAIVLYDRVRKNATIDWTLKESVKAKLKVIVKRTLRQYGYPPDMQKLATETVLKQAELIANELTDQTNSPS